MLSMQGPQFLLLYAITAVLVYILVHITIASREARYVSARDEPIRDPYSIAYLRGGAQELLKVVALTLALRGQLKIIDSTLQAAEPPARAPDALPIEKALLAACETPVKPAEIARSRGVRACTNEFKLDLMQKRLVAGGGVYLARLVPVAVAILLLAGLGLAKIAVALSSGHHNVGLLIIFVIAAVVLLAMRVFRRLTAAGKQTLQKLSGLFADLKKRGDSPPDSAVANAALLAAVFGVYALPGMSASAWTGLWRSEGGDADGGDSDGGGDSGGDGGGSGCGGCGGGGD